MLRAFHSHIEFPQLLYGSLASAASATQVLAAEWSSICEWGLRDKAMETRKKRAAELIEKCDMKVFSNTEKTQIVQIYDRRVKVDLSESILDNTSLYSVARSWIQDDPEKQQPEMIKIRGVRPINASDEGCNPTSSKKRNEPPSDNFLTADSKVCFERFSILQRNDILMV